MIKLKILGEKIVLRLHYIKLALLAQQCTALVLITVPDRITSNSNLEIRLRHRTENSILNQFKNPGNEYLIHIRQYIDVGQTAQSFFNNLTNNAQSTQSSSCP